MLAGIYDDEDADEAEDEDADEDSDAVLETLSVVVADEDEILETCVSMRVALLPFPVNCSKGSTDCVIIMEVSLLGVSCST